MSVVNTLARVGVWVKRFRCRKGYGVHSPFAFNLITRVIYEKDPYYQYAALRAVGRRLAGNVKSVCLNRVKTDQLLFRLVNRMQPGVIVELGTSAGLTTLYLAGAKESACCHTFDARSGVNPVVRNLFAGKGNIVSHTGDIVQQLRSITQTIPVVDFLYLSEIGCYQEAFEACLQKSGENSLFVVKGIHRSKQKRAWWQSVVADKRTGITFDLYDVGLVFFDKQKTKQHYPVNF